MARIIMTAARFDSPTRSLGAFARDVFLHLRVDSVSWSGQCTPSIHCYNVMSIKQNPQNANFKPKRFSWIYLIVIVVTKNNNCYCSIGYNIIH